MSIGITARLITHFVSCKLYMISIDHSSNPYQLYGIGAWRRPGKIHRNKILRRQKRAQHLMFFGDYKSHAIPFYISSNLLLPLGLLYLRSVAILMHHVFNNLSPPQITNIFNFQSNIHPYNTRSSSRGNFFVQYSRLEKQNKSFSRVGVEVWNSLPLKMRHTSKTNF